MVTIGVCDDSALFLEQASEMIEDILKEAGISYQLEKYTDGTQLLSRDAVDILFLDVEMDRLDGLKTADQLRARGDLCRIVFVSAYKKYVFSAFDVEAAHYLVKPLDREKLKQILLRLCAKVQGENRRFLTVKQGTLVHKIPLEQILFMEVFGRKVTLHTLERNWDFYGKLEQLAQTLPSGFFHCHRSFVVNLAHVSQYGKNEAILDNGWRVPIAKRKFGEFGKALLSFLREGGCEL